MIDDAHFVLSTCEILAEPVILEYRATIRPNNTTIWKQARYQEKAFEMPHRDSTEKRDSPESQLNFGDPAPRSGQLRLSAIFSALDHMFNSEHFKQCLLIAAATSLAYPVFNSLEYVHEFWPFMLISTAWIAVPAALCGFLIKRLGFIPFWLFFSNWTIRGFFSELYNAPDDYGQQMVPLLNALGWSFALLLCGLAAVYTGIKAGQAREE